MPPGTPFMSFVVVSEDGLRASAECVRPFKSYHLVVETRVLFASPGAGANSTGRAKCARETAKPLGRKK